MSTQTKTPHSPEPHVAHYQLPEVDLYGPVHKGLRLALTQLVVRLGRTDADDARGVEQALDDLDGLLDLCEAHADHEDTHLHRAIELRHAGGSAWASVDHARQRDAVAALRSLLTAMVEADASTRPVRWRLLQLRYASFVGESLMHMSEEELRLQAELESLHAADELRQVQAQLVQSIPDAQMQAFMRPMLEAATPREREALLAAASGH